MIRKSLLPLLFITLFSTTVFAQVPRMISYQGIITNSTGQPIADGAHTITFTFYPVPVGGAVVYTETIPTTSTGGLVNCIIGPTGPGIPSSVSFDDRLFLAISVDGGADLTPRTMLTSNPFAIRAESAASADVATALAPNAQGVVYSLNEQNGPVTIKGSGAVTVNAAHGVVTIDVPKNDGIQTIQTDSSLAITDASGPITKVVVANKGIKNQHLALNSVGNVNLQNKSVTSDKLNALGSPVGYAALSDGGGNVYWGAPVLQLPYFAFGGSPDPIFTVRNSFNQGSAIRGVLNGGTGMSATAAHAAVWGDATGTQGIGVMGVSNTFAGVHGIGENQTPGVMGTSGSGIGVTGSSFSGSGGEFTTTSGTSTAPALTATTQGTGVAIYGKTMSSTSGAAAILGEVSAIVASGVRGINGGGSGISTGGHAGVWGDAGGANGWGVYGSASANTGVYGQGLNNATGVQGFTAGGTAIAGISATGKAGYFEITNAANTSNAVEVQTNGTGTAIYGKAQNTTASNNGVHGESASPNGAGVKASYVGTGIGTPLTLDNGAIKVTGTNKAAFVHTVTVANRLTTTTTEIDHPLCNNDPNCIINITAVVRDLAQINNLKSQLGIYYDPVRTKWQIISLNAQVFPIPAYFNIWVVKQ